MSDRRTVEFTLNGRHIRVTCEARELFADVLRHQLAARGVHLGCEQGACGACTVLIEGRTTRSCLMLAPQAHGREVRTIESLADGDNLDALQKAFSDHHALQCGFCTPGFLLLAHEFLIENPTPTEQEVRERMSANLCRCTGYEDIVRAVLSAAGQSSPPLEESPSEGDPH